MICGNWRGHGLRWTQSNIIEWTIKKVSVFREHTETLKGTGWKGVYAVVIVSCIHCRVQEAEKGAGRVFNNAGNCYEYTASMVFKNEIRLWRGKPKYWEKVCPCPTFCTTKSNMPTLRSNPGNRGQWPATNRLSRQLKTRGLNQSTLSVRVAYRVSEL
jgi:hypothetical protein